MFWSVDRIESGQAVCISDSELQKVIPLEKLPKGTKEGSVLREDSGVFILDMEEETRRRNRIQALMNALTKEDNQ